MRGVAGYCGIPLVLLVLSNLQASLSTSSGGHQHQIITLDEKREAQFLFITPDTSNDCTFKLSHNGVTFNVNGNKTLSQTFPYEKLLRTSVHVQSAYGFLGVSLSIKNTHSTDRGIYQCRFTCNKTTTVQKAKLLIYYPPDPVDCKWLDKDRVPLEAATFFNLSVLQCTGKNSYPKANVLCYSNRKDKTLIHTPLEITDHHNYIATFWLTREQDLSCCSVSTRFTKSILDCDDFHSLQHPIKATDRKLKTSTSVPDRTDTKEVKASTSQDTLETEERNHSTDKNCEDFEVDDPCSYTEHRIAILTLTVLCVILTLLIFAKPFEKIVQSSDLQKQ